MKRLLHIMFLLMLAVAVSGCGKKDERGKIAGARDRRGGGVTSPDGRRVTGGGGSGSGECGGFACGEITGSPQDAFTDAVRGLVSVTLNPDDLGYVSGRSGDDTGVVFGGFVELNSGRLNPNGSTSGSVRSSSELLIIVWDSFAGETGENGEVIPAYPIYLHDGRARGEVNGNRADITFEDEFGSVRLVGTFDSTEFSGTVKFDNKTYWDGLREGETSGAAGTLGTFRIRTCDFFDCQ